MAPRSWATGAAESCTTDMMTNGSKSGGVTTLHEQEGAALTVRYASSGFSGACETAFSRLRLSL